MMSMENKKKYLTLFIVLLLLSLISYVVPDPIPIVDEAIFTIATVLAGGKLISNKSDK